MNHRAAGALLQCTRGTVQWVKVALPYRQSLTTPCSPHAPREPIAISSAAPLGLQSLLMFTVNWNAVRETTDPLARCAFPSSCLPANGVPTLRPFKSAHWQPLIGYRSVCVCVCVNCEFPLEVTAAQSLLIGPLLNPPCSPTNQRTSGRVNGKHSLCLAGSVESALHFQLSSLEPLSGYLAAIT